MSNPAITLKSIVLLLLLIFLALPVEAFLAQTGATKSWTTAIASKVDKTRDEIAQELEDLGQEIKPQLMTDPKGFDQFFESQIHQLRKELHERDQHYREEIKLLTKNVAALTLLLNTEDIHHQFEEHALKEELREYREEHESVFRLLGEAVKLVGRRVLMRVNGLLRFFRLIKTT